MGTSGLQLGPNRNENKHDSEARMKRGLELLEGSGNGKNIAENADGSFAVPSQTSSKS